MAAHTNTFSVWFITFALLSIQLCVRVFSSSSPQNAEGDKSQCLDGTYKYEGRDCCLCGVGQQVVKHCSASPNDGKCKPCDPERYSSHPNDRMSCLSCTSCSQDSDNLEYEESCTSTRNAKCRCKKDHYCFSGIEPCRLCHPCKECGAEGTKVSCKGNNNTICNDVIERGIQSGTIAGIVIVILILTAVAAAGFIWKKKLFRKTPQTREVNGNAADVEMQPIRVDLQPYLPEIAEAIGWKDMKDIAIRSRIPHTTIEAFILNHPGDAQEQTHQLLRTWVESQGREASQKLVQMLDKSGKKRKAEKVAEIVSNTA